MTNTEYNQTKRSGVLGGTIIAMVMMLIMSVPAEARFSSFKDYYNSKIPSVSDILSNNGFQTLLFALDATGLTAVLDENKVLLFAPTDDVFEATADALGCQDVEDLATRLLNIPVGDTNALAYVLTYHASLGRFKNDYDVLSAGELQMVSGDAVTTGVGANGLFVKGIVNATPSNVTSELFKAKRTSAVYAIDQILLPIDPTGVCD